MLVKSTPGVNFINAFNAGEIDTRYQFHQHFTHTFFVQNFGAKNYKAVFWV